MTAAKQAWLGRFSVDSTLDNLSVGASAISLTTGYYYPAAHSTESSPTTVGLVEQLETQIIAIGATQDASTVALDIDTGIVTITLETAATLTFTDSDLAALLGFDGDQGSATTHTGQYPMRHVWCPSQGFAQHPVDPQEFWAVRSASRLTMSAEGDPHVDERGMQYVAMVGYEYLNRSEVVVDAGDSGVEGNGTFERFFRTVVHQGSSMRIVTDRTSYAASTDYVTAKFGRLDGSPLGEIVEWIEPTLGKDQHSLWDVDCELARYTGSDS